MANKPKGTKQKPSRKTLREHEYYSNGRYFYRYVDANGKNRAISSYILNKGDALKKGQRPCKSLREKEAELQLKLDAHVDIDGAKTKVIDVVEQYLEMLYLKKHIEENTQASYRRVCKLLRDSKLGNMQVGEVKAIHCEEWLKTMKKLYKGSSIQVDISVIKRAFEYAIDHDWTAKNPMRGITVSRDDSEVIEPLTYQQMRSFLEFVKTNDRSKFSYPLVLFLFYTGCRASETCGVCIKDIDFVQKCVYINKQMRNNHKINPMLKTDNGRRVVPLTDELAEVLQQYIDNERAVKFIEPVLVDNDGKEYSGFLFLTKRSRKPMVRANIEEYLRHDIERYNTEHKEEPLKMFRPHACRHTFATLHANINPVVLARILGHGDVRITNKSYIGDIDVSVLHAEMKNVHYE